MDPGTKLGPYEITEQLGAGGMGQVCRARDTVGGFLSDVPWRADQLGIRLWIGRVQTREKPVGTREPTFRVATPSESREDMCPAVMIVISGCTGRLPVATSSPVSALR